MKKEIISTDHAPAAIGPYSQAVEAGGFLFISGQIPLNPDTGKMIDSDIRAATEQVLNNLAAVLVAAHLGYEDVVRTTVYVKDMNDFAAVNEVYAKVFGEYPPARACVEVSRLPKDALVEIDAIAVAR